jgi:para-aminobenzoate synthetase/4-amino-4-deoxychorismate lyase
LKTEAHPHRGYSACIDFKSGVLPAAGLYFDGFERIEQAGTAAEVVPCLERVQRAALEGYYAVGFVAYEAASALDPALKTRSAIGPLVFFGLSREPSVRPPPDPVPFTFSSWSPAWDEADYLQAFTRVQEHIAAGDSYQVNLTFPLLADFHGSVQTCYQQLRQAQSADFCGLISGPEWAVLSVSPELFFERSGTRLRTRPMKGTRKRGRSAEEDLATAEELRASIKDRAENVMIVDLLRNDLGRLAEPGSVKVNSLFNIERFPTVWQMTSEVEARIPADTGLTAIMRAMFPCGSVTGAPKVKSMEIIQRLETASRHVYCGAFGVVKPGGDCVFNVPIRTLLLDRGSGRASYPVGSGVVADSDPGFEYRECLLKSRVLDPLPERFELFETMLWRPGIGVELLEPHLHRLARSARYFGFDCVQERLLESLQQASGNWAGGTRVRMLLAADGRVRFEAEPCAEFPGQVVIKLADEPVNSTDLFLYHKTTRRQVYDRERARLGAADDAILYNERGEITESTVANVAVRLEQGWFTPPVASGLLAGVQRARLLAAGDITERVITVDEARGAGELHLFNALRGRYAARWQ